MADSLVWVVVIILGAAVGSFLNVVIIRTHARKSVVRGQSHCPHCRRRLAWFELIPLISFIGLRGRCRTCSKRIHWQYPLVEGITAFAFLGVWSVVGLSILLLLGWAIAGSLILIAVYDARWALIPDVFTGSLAVTSLIHIGAAHLSWQSHLTGAVAGAIFFGLQYILSRRRWVGSGDIFLGAALGLLLGWQLLGLALFLAYLGGSLLAVILIVTRHLTMRQSMPFGQYLALSSFCVWLWGEGVINWYFNHALFR